MITCPRCTALVLDDPAQVVDTPTGILAVITRPVTTHQHACVCGGFTVTVASSTATTPHPGQLTLIQGAA